MTPEAGAKLLLTVEEAATMLSLGRSKVYDLIAKGEIPSIKIHGSRRVPMDSLSQWIEELMVNQTAPEGSAYGH